MGLDFFISISCLVGAIGLGLSLAVHNHKRRLETHDIRMEIYRRRKKIKNEYLRRTLGLPKPEGETKIEPCEYDKWPSRPDSELTDTSSHSRP